MSPLKSGNADVETLHIEMNMVKIMGLSRMEFSIKGGTIHCQGCEERIRRTLASIDGVLKVDVSRIQHKVQISFNESKTNSAVIRETIENMGYPVVSETSL